MSNSHDVSPTPPIPSPRGRRCSRTIGMVACLLLVAVVNPTGQDTETPPPTIDDITTEMESDADAQGVISAVFGHLFRPRSRPRQEFLLRSQFRAEWLPTVEGVEFVRLAEDEVSGHLASCGRYWMITRLERSGNVVSLFVSQRCGGSGYDYLVSLVDGRWRLGPPDLRSGHGWGPGIASGFVRRPPDCPCLP